MWPPVHRWFPTLALRDLENDPERTPKSRFEAQTLRDKMNNFEIAVKAVFWNNILSRFNSTSKAFQVMDANLQIAIDLLGSLDDYLESFRERFEEVERVAAKLSETTILQHFPFAEQDGETLVMMTILNQTPKTKRLCLQNKSLSVKHFMSLLTSYSLL